MSYPGILVPISGPPSEKNIYEAVPGSAAGLIFDGRRSPSGNGPLPLNTVKSHMNNNLPGLRMKS